MKQVSGQMSLFDRDMPCGRTSPAPSLPTKAKTSVSSSKSSAKLKIPTPIFLDLRGESGILAEPSWETGIPWLGASSTLNFGEYPNVAEESGLWQILQAGAPLKYYLSETACLGVLRRAERRGKELPTILKTALEQQIKRWGKYGTPLPFVTTESEYISSILCYNGEEMSDTAKCLDQTSAKPYCNQGANIVLECYDARGNGDGKVVPTITGDHNGHLSDYTAIVCFSQDAYDKYEETEHGATLRASGGIYGGGSENLVCAGFHPKAAKTASISYVEGKTPTLQSAKEVGVVYCLQGNGIDRADTAGCNGKGVTENVSYTLNTVDRHAVCCVAEGHTHDFLVRMREGKDGGGKGALVQEDKSGTIACNNDQVLFQRAETQYIVRRLTPLECCRLQGMPDFWTDGVEGSDAARYKLWGNGMALPNALYVMEGIAEAKSRRRNKNGIL